MRLSRILAMDGRWVAPAGCAGVASVTGEACFFPCCSCSLLMIVFSLKRCARSSVRNTVESFACAFDPRSFFEQCKIFRATTGGRSFRSAR
jgi:hypothetical protein